MARAPAYNENQFRDYPFLTVVPPLGSSSDAYTHLPPEAIVDFGCIMDLDAEFEEDDVVYLHRIARTGDVFTFTFYTTANEEPLEFTRNSLTDTPWAIEWAESTPSPISSESSSEGTVLVSACSNAGAWRGFLVTGAFTALRDLIPAGDSITFANELWQIEPARVQNIATHYLRSITLLNRPRTQPTDEQDTTPQLIANCLDGRIQFQEGYNCSIRQDNAANRIVLGGTVGAGAGEPCGTSSQNSSDVLCGEVLKTINGKSGKRINITGGPGFTIEADPDTSTLYIDRDMSQFVQCEADQ